jgi:hypothetical protein
MKNTLVIMECGPYESNNDLLNDMRKMKNARELNCAHIVCVISGFDNDKREMFQIPEARAFCRRLVDIGFISYLDNAVCFGNKDIDVLGGSWGDFEVWTCAEGRFHDKAEQINSVILKAFKHALLTANAKSDSLVGEFKK